MARPRAFDETSVLLSIEDVFWRQGYEQTSYADLMRASGLGKGSLYAAFGDKQALYLKALGGYIDREIGEIGAMLLDPRTPGLARITAFLDYPVQAVAANNDRRGCFLCNAAVDLAPHDPAAARMISSALSAARQGIGVAIAACGPTAVTADGLLAAYLGMRVLAKAGADVASLKAARDTAMLGFGGASGS